MLSVYKAELYIHFVQFQIQFDDSDVSDDSGDFLTISIRGHNDFLDISCQIKSY